MVRPRIIPCLLLKGKGLVKTKQFKNPIYLGDPLNTFNIFNKKMVDEIILLDIEASKERVKPNFELISRISSICFSPLTYGGGISCLNDAEILFKIGVEKISINTIAFKDPKLITELAKNFGSQSVVVSVNIYCDIWGKYKFVNNSLNSICNNYSIYEQIKIFEDYGAGEILVNDVNRDGMMNGYNFELIKGVSSSVSIPVIACGGSRTIDDMRKVILECGASAAAAASMFVFNGKYNAVLISYPDWKIIKKLLC